MSVRLSGAVLPFLMVACTSMLGIDGQYVLEVSEDAGATGGRPTHSGGSANGGAGGTGGTAGSGGSAQGGTAGIAGAGGSGTGGAASCDSDAASCANGEKCCPIPQPTGAMSKACVGPIPIVGCSAASCDPCPAPPLNTGVAVCNAQGNCDFECINGYAKVGNACEPINPPDASGAGGTPPTPTCKPSTCHSSCSVFGPFSCCKADKTCGCTWAIGAACW